MSVTTQAGIELDKARGHVQRAIEALSDIVVNQVWGHDEFTAEFRKTLKGQLMLLLAVREELK